MFVNKMRKKSKRSKGKQTDEQIKERKAKKKIIATVQPAIPQQQQ